MRAVAVVRDLMVGFSSSAGYLVFFRMALTASVSLQVVTKAWCFS